MSKVVEKKYSDAWDEFVEKVRSTTTANVLETPEERRKRIQSLEANPEAWFKYYFPKYAYAEPTAFHKAATKRVLNNPEYYEIRHWSRELAKSARTMMEVLYLALTGKKRNILLISNSNDNAERLLTPYQIHLEMNGLIIQDYGKQERLGKWKAGEFVTRKKVAFRAVGAGQAPRGSRNEEVRPDVILFDDLDTDEDCRNPDTLDKRWDWVNKAVMGTRSISVPLLVIWCGNIIAEDCCIVRAQEIARKCMAAKMGCIDIVNIRDEYGRSTWPQKNTEEFIDNTLRAVSFNAQQSEYFNNPYTEGRAFSSVTYGKVPPITKFQYLVCYGDPATSNNDKGKGTTGASYKAVILAGLCNQTYYVIKAFVAHMKNAEFVDCFYAMDVFINNKVPLFSYIENNTLQDPFFQQVFKPLFFEKSKQFGRMVSIIPDGRRKPEKYTRIEGTLEPINRMGLLIFNEAEKETDHMKLLVSQLKSVSAMSKTMDGPDALEGAVVKINERISTSTGINTFARPTNPKRY
jgi:hypothetical protein